MEVTFHVTTSYGMIHVIHKTITRTRTPKGGGLGLTNNTLKFNELFGIIIHIEKYIISKFIEGHLAHVGEETKVEINRDQKKTYWLSLGIFSNMDSGR